MKITKSKLWKHPGLMATILKNSPPLDPSVILFNSEVYMIKKGSIISFLTLKKYDGFYELKTAYTYPGYRNKGYAEKLVKKVLSTTDSDLFLQCDSKLEKLYKKCGFKKTDKMSLLFRIRENLFNLFLSRIFGYKIITMRKK
ncbi:GNAT family N-acetyltransferase [Candidatus Woesearchaeota archaeon]|nr:GNAT family N-acetyltransferase [Candidatus Woesearchaeota archaeon]